MNFLYFIENRTLWQFGQRSFGKGDVEIFTLKKSLILSWRQHDDWMTRIERYVLSILMLNNKKFRIFVMKNSFKVFKSPQRICFGIELGINFFFRFCYGKNTYHPLACWVGVESSLSKKLYKRKHKSVYKCTVCRNNRNGDSNRCPIV